MTSPSDEDVIRITLGEANSSHVDDLLRRQASLRGETGIARDRRGHWFYQTWFILMLAGAFAAALSWAIIEPHFDDQVHWSGSIESAEVMEAESDAGDPALLGTITVSGQAVTVGEFTRSLQNRSAITREDVEVGRLVELYLEPVPDESGQSIQWFATFLDPVTELPTGAGDLTVEDRLRRSSAAGMVVFALMAGLIGLFIGAADGLVCRVWSRAALCGVVGLGVGLLGGFILSIIANLVYNPLNNIAQEQSAGLSGTFSPLGFSIQMAGRTLAWGLVGVAMGLGQGIALRSPRLVVFGVIGGVVGGVLGGLLFDPIDLLLLGTDKPSAHVSRLVGFVLIGACVGGMIGLVELLARDAWLRMEEGPLAGKEFLVFKDVMKIGASPRSDIYLFNDPRVEGHHATLRAIGEEVEVESASAQRQVLVNDRTVRKSRLRHGDRITIGRTVFVYQRRGG